MAKNLDPDLTTAQERIARMLARYEREERPAFVPDLLQSLKYAAESSLTPTLKIMERKGFLDVLAGGAKGRSRLLRLTAKGRHALGIGGLPLLGSIPAGPLSEAIAQAEKVVDPGEMVPYKPGDFLLRVRGESMIGDGILDGDLVLLRPGARVSNGAIAAVCVGDDREGTLKRVLFENDRVRLRASNPEFKDVVVAAERVSFAGLLKGVFRSVGGRN